MTGRTPVYLAETLGITLAGYRDTIMMRRPGRVESVFFRLPNDGSVPVIEVRRTAYDQHGVPIRLTASVYPADRSVLAVNVGAGPTCGRRAA